MQPMVRRRRRRIATTATTVAATARATMMPVRPLAALRQPRAPRRTTYDVAAAIGYRNQLSDRPNTSRRILLSPPISIPLQRVIQTHTHKHTHTQVHTTFCSRPVQTSRLSNHSIHHHHPFILSWNWSSERNSS